MIISFNQCKGSCNFVVLVVGDSYLNKIVISLVHCLSLMYLKGFLIIGLHLLLKHVLKTLLLIKNLSIKFLFDVLINQQKSIVVEV